MCFDFQVLSSTLQVLFNLHSLWPGVRSLCDEMIETVDASFSLKAVTASFDVGKTVVVQSEKS